MPPRPRAVGQYREKNGRAYYRLKLTETELPDGERNRRPSFAIALPPGKEARARAALLERFVRELRAAGHHKVVAKFIEEAAAGTDDDIAGAEIVVRDLCAGSLKLAPGFSSSMLVDDLV